MDLNGGALKFDALINRTDFDRQMQAIENRILGLYDRTEAESHRLDKAFTTLSATITGAFSVAAITGFVQSLVKTRGEFQQIEVAFTTMLKSKAAADQLMKEAVTLAATTPFGLQDVATGAKQLLAYGTQAKDVTGTLTMLGNVAAGVSAPLGDIVYLYGTLQTQGRAYSKDIQQFTGRGIPIIKELAEQFSVSESEVMKLVEAGKVGFPEVQKAFQSMTSSSGIFYNLMQEQSKTLTGQLANLSDAWDMMLNSLGRSNEGILSGSIELATELVENYEKVLSILAGLIAGYGAYRAALMATAVMETSTNLIREVTLINGARLTAMQKLHVLWIAIETKAQAALNTVMLANPYALVAAAAVALGVAMYALHDSISATEKAQRQLNDENEKSAKHFEDLKTKANDLNTVLRDKNTTEYQQSKAYKELQTLYPGILSNLSKETYLKLEAADAQKQLNAENDKLQVADIGQRFEDAKAKIIQVNTEIQKYNDLIRSTGDQGGALVRHVEDLRKELEVSTIKAEELGKEFQAQNEELIYSLKPEEEKKKYLQDQLAELGKQKQAMIDLNGSAIDLQNTFASYNFNNLLKQIDTVQQKLNGLNKVDKQVRTITVIDSDIEKLKDDQKGTSTRADYVKIQNQIDKLEEERARITGKRSKETTKLENEETAALKRKADMLNKVYDLNSKYNNKTLTDDEQKLQEIRKEYKALQKDIDAYNKDPKNKKINPNLKPQMEKAIEYKQYEIDTEKLKTSLDKEKQLYSDYEEYKSALGKEAADKRYASELTTSVNFLQKLEAERAKLLDKDPTTMTGQELSRLKLYDNLINEEVSAEKKKQDDLTKSLISYQQERLNLIAKYNDDIKSLENDPTAKAERTTRFNEDLKDLDDSHIKKLDSYKLLFEGIDQLSEANARKVVANAGNLLDELIKKGIGSPELRRELARLLKQSTDALDQRLPSKLIDIAGQIDGIANSVSLVDEEFGKVLGTLGNVLGQVGNIKKGIKDFGDFGSKGNTLGQLGAGLGILGAGISIFSSVFKLFDRSAQREEQAAYSRDLQNKQTEALNKALERQISLLDQVYGTQRIKDYEAAIKQANENEAKYLGQLSGKFLLTNDAETNKLITKINNGEKAKNIFEKLAIEDLKKGGSLKGLPTDIASLQVLLDEGKLDANTATIVENLIKANETAQQLANNLRAERVGAGLSTIVDEFISTLTDGAQDFGGAFEKIIRRSLLNGLKGQITAEFLQKFYEQLDNALADGAISSEEDASLKELYKRAEEYGKKKLEYIDTIAPDDSKDKDPSALKPNTLTASMNQPTAERLEGLWRGQYDLTDQIKSISLEALDIYRRELELSEKFGLGFQDQLSILNSVLVHMANIDTNTLRSANNTDGITDKLDQIINNTKQPKNTRD